MTLDRSRTLAAPPTDATGKYHALSVFFWINHTLFLNSVGLSKSVVVTPVMAGVDAASIGVHVVPL